MYIQAITNGVLVMNVTTQDYSVKKAGFWA